MDRPTIQAPKFKPNQWVMYMNYDTPAFGQVFSGKCRIDDDGTTWVYMIRMRVESDWDQEIDEEDIFAVFDGKQWHDTEKAIEYGNASP